MAGMVHRLAEKNGERHLQKMHVDTYRYMVETATKELVKNVNEFIKDWTSEEKNGRRWTG